MIEDNENHGRRPVAYLNETFLESPDARGLRILSEYLEPLSHFRDENIQAFAHDAPNLLGEFVRTVSCAEIGRNSIRATAGLAKLRHHRFRFLR